jgi:hydrogenase maturation protease
LNDDTLIVGYGNPARADDGFGYRAAKRIPSALAVQQLTPELMERMSRAGRVIFLDASTEGVPGEISRRTAVPCRTGPIFTHHLMPEMLLGGALVLYGRAPEAQIITVCGADWSASDRLSPAVAASLEAIVRELGQLRRA